MTDTVTLVNPPDGCRAHLYRKQKWLFTFGAYGCTRCVVWARHLEDALEIAAEWLASEAPGLIMAHDSEELEILYEEARDNLGIECEASDEDTWRVHDEATVDLTYTESGYLVAYEWWVNEIDRNQMKAMQADGVSFERAQDQ